MAQQELGSAEIVILLVVYGGIILVALAIQGFISYLLYKAADSIPQQFRQVEPWQAFLFFVPLFNLIWIFIFTSKLSGSFQHFIGSQNQLRDDCGKQVGMWWGICAVAGIIPCIGALFGIGGLICMIIYLVKTHECKLLARQIGSGFIPPMGPGSERQGPKDPHNPYAV